MIDNNSHTASSSSFPPSDWVETTLGEVCEKMYSGGTPSTQRKDFYNGEIPWIRTQEVNFNYLNDTDIKITEIGFKNSSAKWIPKNTVIIAMYGNSAGRVAFSNIEATTNQACCNCITNKSLSDPKFIFFNLLSRYSEIVRIANGAAQQNLSVEVLKEFPIFLPPLPEQQAITSVLSAFDDKIELLREQNKTLEAIGQTLFNYEFKMMNEKSVKAQEILEFEKGIEVGSNNYFENKNDLKNPVMFYRVGDIENNGNLSSIYCEKDLLKNKIFKNDDVLVSFDGTVGRVFIGRNGGYSSGIRKIFAKEKNIKNSFLYFWAKSENVQKTINLYSEGTTIQHAGKSISYLEIISNQKNIDEITENLEPIFTKILDNLKQIQSLTHTRDELLPKLMRGEIRVI